MISFASLKFKSLLRWSANMIRAPRDAYRSLLSITKCTARKLQPLRLSLVLLLISYPTSIGT